MTYLKNPDEPEKIICAAIHYDDGKRHNCQPDNIESGFVIGSRRHDSAIYTLHALGFMPKGKHVTQGFISTHNRFLNRYEAGRVAEAAHQWEGNGMLFSEDIY